MAALNETPRQKMMGILYLVLLGIAATTVTDHVLDAFSNLTVSLETSTKNVQSTVGSTFSAFEATKLKSDPVRNTPIFDRANKIKKYVDDLDNYINEVKNKLTTEGGGINEKDGELKAKADVDISPRVMVRKGLAKELKNHIEDTRKKILETLDKSEMNGLNLALNAQDPPKKVGQLPVSWEEDNFGDGIPLVAAITALTKIQSDLKNSESDVIGRILQADKTQIVMDRFEAVAIAPSSYVLVGEPYKAEVFLTASNSTSNPEIVIGGQKLNVVNGKGLYTAAGTTPGEKKWSGTIRVKKTDGTYSEYKVPEQTYTVALPSATISPDKMNVFYIGIPNPVSISAPGFPDDKVHVTMNAGEITGHSGSYMVNFKPANRGKVTVTVSGELEKGKNKVLATKEFRVKSIPPPRVKFANKGGGKLSAVAMKSANRIFAMLEDFEFEATFTIKHFTIYINKPRADVFVKESNSNVLTPEMQSAMNTVTPGSRVTFDNILVIGPDGIQRALDPITFSVE
jgi:gliding motility-associated protein GldM